MQLLGPNHSMELVYAHDRGSDAGTLAAAIELAAYCDSPEKQIWAVAGPPTSHQTIVLSLALTPKNVPIVSPSATNPELSNKAKYPTVSRLQASDAYSGALRLVCLFSSAHSLCGTAGVVFARMVAYFGWTRVAVIFSQESYGRALVSGMSRLVPVCFSVVG
jgi:hypothetical protein